VSTLTLAPRAPVASTLRSPGLGALPRAWRHSAMWRTVIRFVLLGPLIGGAPYVLLLFTIPFAYFIGALPAFIAGVLFGTWYHGPGRPPGWRWRAAMGALCGGVAAVLAGLAFTALAGSPAGPGRQAWFMVSVMALHGVPAAVALALMQKPSTTGRAAGTAAAGRDIRSTGTTPRTPPTGR